MILDARRLEAERLPRFDVCIVGGGPAGITIALALAGSGARICVLEAGGHRYEARTQALLEGDVSGQPYPRLRDTRFAALGGATRLWAGWCRPLDEIDFVDRPWVSASGWPFGRDELVPSYRRAHELCGLADFEYDPAAWEGRGAGEPLPIDDPDLATSMFHVNPVDFGRAHGATLRRAPNVHVVLHAIVERVRTADASERVETVDVATLSGRRFSVGARFFVLAAGGVENPRLLMLSGPSPERSPGNSHGLVGRFFTEHAFIDPGSYLARKPAPSLRFYFPTRVSEIRPASVRAAFSLSRGALEREKLLNSAVFFRPAYEAHEVYATPEVRALLEAWEAARGRGVPGHALADLGRALRAPRRVAHAIWRKLAVKEGASTRWRMRAFFECESRESNRVLLSERKDRLGRPLPRIEWRLGDLDIRSIRYAWSALDRALVRADLGRLKLAIPDEADAWRGACEGGKHHMGTTRMHADPHRGVVDPDSRVHGTANLYVAGSSVFPTCGFANPTLTIVALAARLGRHIASLL